MEMSNPITKAHEKPSGKPGRRPRAGGRAFSVALALSVAAVSVAPAAVATTGAPHRGAGAA
ncbi:hypothetical protein, partial [Streptomyces anulatus]